MNTNITEKVNGIDVSADVFAKLVNDRILFLSDYIDDKVATDIVAALLYLESKDPNAKISLYINSEGGDVRSVFMIYDVLRLLKTPIQTICLGSATFLSAVILAAGTKGMRYATKSSIICISQLTIDGVMYVDMTDARISLEQLKKDNKKLMTILSKLTGKKMSVLTKDCERKFFMTPERARRYGIIDHVMEWSR